MSNTMIPIPGRLHAVDTDGIVAGANEILDDTQGIVQSEINKEVVGTVAYDSDNPNGMGRIVLKKTDNFKEVVEVQTNGNTIFVIKYDYTLTGDVTIPANCVLQFAGGSISAGSGENMDTITFNNTTIDCVKKYKCLNIKLGGTRNNKIANNKIHLSWFKNSGEDCTEILNKLVTLQKFIFLDINQVILSSPVYIPYAPGLQIKGLPSYMARWGGNGTTVRPSANFTQGENITRNNISMDTDGLFVIKDSQASVDIEHINFIGAPTDSVSTADIKVNSGVLSCWAFSGKIHNCAFTKFGGAAINIYETEHCIIENNIITWCNCCINVSNLYVDFDNYKYYEPDNWLSSAVNDTIIKDNYTGECLIGIRVSTGFGCRIINNYFAHSTFYGIMIVNSQEVFVEGNVLENCGGRSFNISKTACSNEDASLLTSAYINERRRTVNDFPGFGRKDANGKVWRSQVLVVDSKAHFKGNSYSCHIKRSYTTRASASSPYPNYILTDNTIHIVNDNTILGNDCLITISGGAVDFEDRNVYGMVYPYMIHYYVDSLEASNDMNSLRYNRLGQTSKPILITTPDPNSFYNHYYNIIPTYNSPFSKIPIVGPHATMINEVAKRLETEDKGFKFFNTSLKRNFIWNGDKFVDDKGFTPCIKKGTTAERPISIYSFNREYNSDSYGSGNMYRGMQFLNTTNSTNRYATISLRVNGYVLGGSSYDETVIKTVDNSVLRKGTTAQRPSASDIYIDFEYYDTDLNKYIYAKRFIEIDDVITVEWAERTALPSGKTNCLTYQDEGFEYFDTDLHKPIYAKEIDITTGTITWVDATGTEV